MCLTPVSDPTLHTRFGNTDVCIREDSRLIHQLISFLIVQDKTIFDFQALSNSPSTYFSLILQANQVCHFLSLFRFISLNFQKYGFWLLIILVAFDYYFFVVLTFLWFVFGFLMKLLFGFCILLYVWSMCVPLWNNLGLWDLEFWFFNFIVNFFFLVIGFVALC